MAINRTSPKKGKVVDIPTAPTIGTATAGAASATVAFTASTKGGPVTTYTALSNPGSITATGSSSPLSVIGLTAGTTYTFTVRGNNATGSSEYGSASNSVVPTVATSFDSIATTTLTSDQANIQLTSIPGTYKHLQIRAVLRSNRSGSPTDAQLRINGNTGANYMAHRIEGDGSLTYAGGGGGASSILINRNSLPSNESAANIFAVYIIDILDYANTNKIKPIRVLSGADISTRGGISLISGALNTTDAITSITVFEETGANLLAGSTMALYGIKG